ncbi:GNAT family N-acetyltransferase [Arthrobacter rhizosphaerae]|uniref:GNAT family N-acetyltransferase n=1 Tax=Arthrobacter rhizosphaerae TaxID=2855490 RepID=UPI001FF2BAB0|nr:GNAT family N-acetyltransferase [Arthrobacter rhizosphaerae]
MSRIVTIVRIAGTAECAPIRELAVEHARHEQSPTVIPLDWADRIAKLIHVGRLNLFVAMVSGNPVGYAALTSDVETWAALPYGHLDCLYVDEEYRDFGVGRLLMDAVIVYAQDQGFGELQWQTPAWNAKAIRFYDRLGGKRQAKQRFTLALRELVPEGQNENSLRNEASLSHDIAMEISRTSCPL